MRERSRVPALQRPLVDSRAGPYSLGSQSSSGEQLGWATGIKSPTFPGSLPENSHGYAGGLLSSRRAPIIQTSQTDLRDST